MINLYNVYVNWITTSVNLFIQSNYLNVITDRVFFPLLFPIGARGISQAKHS